MVPKLTEVIKELRTQELAISYLEKLSNSMPRRLQMVIEVKGDASSTRNICRQTFCAAGTSLFCENIARTSCYNFQGNY